MKFALILIALFLVMFLLGGCVPVAQYQGLQRRLQDETVKRKNAERKADACEVREVDLKKQLEQKPAAGRIEPEKLQEIKKQALEEAERSSKGAAQKK